jgi:hypothetical protein
VRSFAPNFIIVADPAKAIMGWDWNWDRLQATLGLNLVVYSQNSVLMKGGTVRQEGPIVEAFPNAFLGVLMPEIELLAAPRFKRGRRFDWLYEGMVTSGRLESVLSNTLDLPHAVWDRLRSETVEDMTEVLRNIQQEG